jgi:hypothetical protein
VAATASDPSTFGLLYNAARPKRFSMIQAFHVTKQYDREDARTETYGCAPPGAE